MDKQFVGWELTGPVWEAFVQANREMEAVTEQDRIEMAEAFRQHKLSAVMSGGSVDNPEDWGITEVIEWRYCTVEGRWRNMEWSRSTNTWLCDGCEAAKR